MSETYTVAEICQILDCSEETAAERLTAGDLPGLKIGRSWVIPVQAFTQRLNELALQQAEQRRSERTARSTASRTIATASGARAPRRRVPPALPSCP